jgi:hypothetical protein
MCNFFAFLGQHPVRYRFVCRFPSHKPGNVMITQSDQIGRILACWAIVYFGQLFENFISSPNFWDIFSTESNVLILRKSWLGYNLCDIFTNSSGHHVTMITIFDFPPKPLAVFQVIIFILHSKDGTYVI